MKRRMPEEAKGDDAGGNRAASIRSMIAALVQEELSRAICNPSTRENVDGRRRVFGSVAFTTEDKRQTDKFLHQKLGKENLARRPGPRGTNLTYIESCKAIELANRAFGFNGWSCHIVECCEEYREKKGERWSIGFSSLVRIELRDGTSHEDVGFGQSDGQRDLGAALEQAKKASISDARKRALRLFGEFLGNSCYDREHIKDVLSNKRNACAVPPLQNDVHPAMPMAVSSAIPPPALSATSVPDPAYREQTSRAGHQSHQLQPTAVAVNLRPTTSQDRRAPYHNTPPGSSVRNDLSHPPAQAQASGRVTQIDSPGISAPPYGIKQEQPIRQGHSAAAEFELNDLSLSQFDFDPNESSVKRVKT